MGLYAGAGVGQLRKSRVSSVGNFYHVTFSTFNRLPVFSDFNKARLMTKYLRLSDQRGISETMAFVVMPDHVHWLFQLKFGQLSQCLQRVRGQFSREYGQRIWNLGYHDHAIRSDENLKDVARYIIANPIRAGLVDRAGDYSHWDASWI